MINQTLVILKPGCLQRGIVGELISIFEKKGLKIISMKMSLITKEKAEIHYAEHKDKPFFKPLVEYITSSPVILIILTGYKAVQEVREITKAIRSMYTTHFRKNVIHTSDSEESALREIKNLFNPDEIIGYNYERDIDNWTT